MEIISCHTARSYCVVDFKGVKELDLHRPKLPVTRDKAISSVVYTSRLKKVGQQRVSTTVCSVNGYEDATTSVLSETYDSYVLGGEVGRHGLRGASEAIPKVSIPSLPDEDNGDNVASINSCFWEWKPNFNVHYETSGVENVNSPPVLFLPGFGVGSFHYKKQLKDLGRDYRVWALDYLGQGMSLPNEDPTLQLKDGKKYMLPGQNDIWGFGDENEIWAEELVYSADLWLEQVHKFVEEVHTHTLKHLTRYFDRSYEIFFDQFYSYEYPIILKNHALNNSCVGVWLRI